MAKSRNPEPIAMEEAVRAIQDYINAQLISDKDIEWEDCVDGLEEIAEWCLDWARHIRSEHK